MRLGNAPLTGLRVWVRWSKVSRLTLKRNPHTGNRSAKSLNWRRLDLDDLEQLPLGIEDGNCSTVRLSGPSSMTDGVPC